MIPHSALATRFLLAALALFACTGCSDDGGSDFGSIQIFIQPRNFGPFTDTDFEANASLKTPAGQPATFSFSWERDGMPTGNDTRFVDSDDTTKNEVWTVTVTAQAGGRDFGPETLDVPILNSPPDVVFTVLSTGPMPFQFRECDDLVLNIVSETDADGDPFARTLTEWLVGGVVVATDVDMLDESFYEAGDQVTLEMTYDDTQDEIIVSRIINILNVPMNPCPVPVSERSRDGSVTVRSLPAPGGGGAAAASGATDLLRASRSLAISSTHVCSLGAGGGLACSGPDDSALADVPEGSYALVASGPDYACAIGAGDGQVVCWGDAPAESGLLEPPEGRFAALALGLERACGLRSTGEPACWGLPLPDDMALPGGPFVGIDVAEDDYFCAIDAAGDVGCWGGE